VWVVGGQVGGWVRYTVTIMVLGEGALGSYTSRGAVGTPRRTSFMAFCGRLTVPLPPRQADLALYHPWCPCCFCYALSGGMVSALGAGRWACVGVDGGYGAGRGLRGEVVGNLACEGEMEEVQKSEKGKVILGEDNGSLLVGETYQCN